MTDTPTPTPPIIPGVDEPVGWESVTFEPAEIAITVIIYLGFAILLVVHLYGLTFARTYRPLQARQPILSFVSLLCTVLLTGTRRRSHCKNTQPSRRYSLAVGVSRTPCFTLCCLTFWLIFFLAVRCPRDPLPP